MKRTERVQLCTQTTARGTSGRHARKGNTLSGYKQALGLLHLRTLIHVKRRSVTPNCFFSAAAALWWPSLGHEDGGMHGSGGGIERNITQVTCTLASMGELQV